MRTKAITKRIVGLSVPVLLALFTSSASGAAAVTPKPGNYFGITDQLITTVPTAGGTEGLYHPVELFGVGSAGIDDRSNVIESLKTRFSSDCSPAGVAAESLGPDDDPNTPGYQDTLGATIDSIFEPARDTWRRPGLSEGETPDENLIVNRRGRFTYVGVVEGRLNFNYTGRIEFKGSGQFAKGKKKKGSKRRSKSKKAKGQHELTQHYFDGRASPRDFSCASGPVTWRARKDCSLAPSLFDDPCSYWQRSKQGRRIRVEG